MKIISARTVTVLFLLAGIHVSVADDAAPIRVGIIGLDNYQALDFTSQFHNPAAPEELKGLKVVAGYAGGSPDIQESVESLPKWLPGFKEQGVEILDSIEAVRDRSDAILIMSLDGRTHLEDLKKVGKSGVPVYIGRPMAASLPEVISMFEFASKHDIPLFSCSQHRYVPGFRNMRGHPEVGNVLGADVWGGCPEDPLHPDTVWKGLHGIETLYTLLGPGCLTVTRASTPDCDVLTGVWNDGRIGSYRGIRRGAVTYRAMVFGDKGISPSGDYGYDVPTNWVAPHGEYWGYKGVAIEIVRFFKTRQPPVSPEETMEIFAFMEAAHESKRRGGSPVSVAEVLTEAVKAAKSVATADTDGEVRGR
ncbi:MAG: gfo/Idh/MocA family oxidoreductase [Planctomyces sp.]